jgi:hypothetical protein
MESDTGTLLGLDASAWVVVAIGVATVLSQLYAARKGAAVAERQAAAAEAQAILAGKEVAAAESQLAASQAALDRELSAVLVVTRGAYDLTFGDVRVHNGGLHPATAIKLSVLDESGRSIASGTIPMVESGGEEGTRLQLLERTPEQREAFGRSRLVDLEWVDGRGPQASTQSELFALQ